MDKQNGLTEQRKALLKGIKKIVIKIGSAVLTDNGVLHRPTIIRLADDIAFLRKKGYQTVIVSSGAIASGVGKLGLSRKPDTIPQKQAVAAIGQGSLMYAYEEAFNTHQLLVAQILLTREDLTNRQRYLNARNTLITLLEWGIIPIINENDTVAVDEIKFGDNDNLSALIAHLIESDLLIVLTDTEGLYDRDPREDPRGPFNSRGGTGRRYRSLNTHRNFQGNGDWEGCAPRLWPPERSRPAVFRSLSPTAGKRGFYRRSSKGNPWAPFFFLKNRP